MALPVYKVLSAQLIFSDPRENMGSALTPYYQCAIDHVIKEEKCKGNNWLQDFINSHNAFLFCFTMIER
jgi:hypothetical protein